MKIKLHRSGNDLYTIQMIPRQGTHHYKFFVDGEWKTDASQPVEEQSGYKNNVINLESFVTYDMEEEEEKSDEEDANREKAQLKEAVG